MLRLADAWTWDFWVVDNGQEYHLFFLKAPKSLGDPDQRHFHANVGHAVSVDLCNWELLPDAIVPGERSSFDDIAIWTGSVVNGLDGRWYMYYTGITTEESGLVQRIGLATSEDLIHWEKDSGFTVLSADCRWYEKLGEGSWSHEAWRDPWVFKDPSGNGWHMFVTARSRCGAEDSRGVVGHLVSEDLLSWEVTAPVTKPESGFGVMEVMQVEEIDGQAVLLFSCQEPELGVAKRENHGRGGIWVAKGGSLLGGFELANAQLLSDDSLYSGRVVRNRLGNWVMLAFRNKDANGEFVGEITDPIPLAWKEDGMCALVGSGRHLSLEERARSHTLV